MLRLIIQGYLGVSMIMFLKVIEKKKNSLSINTIIHAFVHQILIKVWWKKD